MEGYVRSRKVMEGYGWSFPITGLTFQGRKVTGGGVVVVACKIIVSAPVPFFSFGLWILIFWTSICDLDLGLGIGLGLDN